MNTLCRQGIHALSSRTEAGSGSSGCSVGARWLAAASGFTAGRGWPAGGQARRAWAGPAAGHAPAARQHSTSALPALPGTPLGGLPGLPGGPPAPGARKPPQGSRRPQASRRRKAVGSPLLCGPVQGLGVDSQAHDGKAVVNVQRLARHCAGRSGGGGAGGRVGGRRAGGGEQAAGGGWQGRGAEARWRSASWRPPRSGTAARDGCAAPRRRQRRSARAPAEARGEHRKAATAPTSVAASSFFTGAFSYE